MNTLTICYWEFINFFALQDNMIFSYCFMKDESMKCLQSWSVVNNDSMGKKVIEKGIVYLRELPKTKLFIFIEKL